VYVPYRISAHNSAALSRHFAQTRPATASEYQHQTHTRTSTSPDNVLRRPIARN